MVEFVDVIVKATGRTERVPADWLDSPVLGGQFELAPPPVQPVDPSEAPTEKDKVETIETFAADHGIDLGDASTKAEKVDVIRAALEAAAPPVPEPVNTNPDVQTVAGQASTESPYPAVAAAQAAAAETTTGTGGTGPSDETPAAGEQEN